MSHGAATEETGFSSHPYLIAVVLGGAMAVATVAGTLVGVLAPYLRDEIGGLTAANVGLLVAAFAVVSGAMAWPAGLLTDAIGGRTALILVLAGSVLGLGFLAVAPTFEFLLAAMVVAGVANSAVNPATNRVIASWVAPGQRGLVAGIKMAGVQVAVFAAGILIPPAAETIGWRIPLVSAGVLVAGVGTGCAVLLLRGGDTLREARRDRPGFSPTGGLAALTIYSLFMSGGASATITYISLFTVEDLGSTARIGGLAVALIGLLAIGGRLALGRITERLGRPMRSLAAVGAVASASAALIALSASADPILYWVGAVGLGLSALSFIAGTTVALIVSTPVELIGGSSGAMFVGFMIGFGGGPAAFGWVLDAYGSYALGWSLVMGLFGMATITAWIAWRFRVLDTPRARRSGVGQS